MPADESTIHINRTPQAVFAFVSDYECDPGWRSEALEGVVLSFAPSCPDAVVQKDC